METKEIIENNKLIAEFMGVKQSDEFYKDHFTFVGSDLKKAGLPFATIMGNCIDNPPFNSSWDWLMPVVEKIENLNEGVYQVDILQEGCKILLRCKKFIDKTVSNLPPETEKIESVYLAIVQFIKWYNENK